MRKVWLGLFLLVTQVQARPTQEPQSFAVVYRIEGQNLSPLEIQRPQREVLELRTPVRREYLAIPSPRSPVRFTSQQGLRFVIRFRLSQPDFAWNFTQLEPTNFSLYLLQREDNRRVLLLNEQTPIRQVQYPGMPLRITPYGKDSLILELPPNLLAGEYAIVYGKDSPCDTFCFALDGSAASSSVSP